MRIGIDASRANLDKKTGVEFYSYFLIQELKKIIGAPHKVILYSREPLRGELGELPPNWERRLIKSPVFIPFRGKKPFLWTQLGLSLEMFLRPPDVLFVPSHALPLIYPKKSVVTIHDIGFERFPESYHPLARAYHRLAAKFAVRRAKKIIAISEFTKKELVEVYGADPQKILVIPLAYDSVRFHENLDAAKTAAVLAKHGLADKSYLFYVGRLEKKKNLITLIKAFNSLIGNCPAVRDPPLAEKLSRLCRGSVFGGEIGNYQLVLAGSPAYGFEEIQAAIKKSPARERIRILDYVLSEELPYLMSGAAVFVFPSLYEGFGIPILESMAVGTPVVCSDIPALRELSCSNAECRLALPTESRILDKIGTAADTRCRACAVFFANPQSPENFAGKINFLLEDPRSPTVQTMGLPAREELIKRGFRQAEKYSWAETAQFTAQVLTS